MGTWVIKDADGNVTNPGINATEEFVAANFDHYEAFVDTERPAPTDEELARMWRDSELERSDSISQTPDHPERAAYLTYRTVLRDWPSTSDFPDTRPELGS